jgi:hypothetical protein
MTSQPFLDAPGAAIPRPTAKQKVARVPFRPLTPAGQQRCQRLLEDGSPCPRWAEHWHHWVPQSWIRRNVESRVYRGMSRRAAKAVLFEWLRDPRNLTPMCADCHLLGEPGRPRAQHGRRFRRSEVPYLAFEFAAELGLVASLERLYPA